MFIFYVKLFNYIVMIFMVKHLIAIIILMAGTFSIGFWFGKNNYNIKNYLKSVINKFSKNY